MSLFFFLFFLLLVSLRPHPHPERVFGLKIELRKKENLTMEPRIGGRGILPETFSPIQTPKKYYRENYVNKCSAIPPKYKKMRKSMV